MEIVEVSEFISYDSYDEPIFLKLEDVIQQIGLYLYYHHKILINRKGKCRLRGL